MGGVHAKVETCTVYLVASKLQPSYRASGCLEATPTSLGVGQHRGPAVDAEAPEGGGCMGPHH